MRVLRTIVLLILGMSLPLAGTAQSVQLNPERPDRYVVVKGDTLWDISGRFLQEPWLWPEVWEINPQIENPHLIYPGDEISLVFAEGQPRLRVRRGPGGRRTVKLSPRVRAERIDTAIPTIPIDDIHQFLNRPRVLTEADLDAAPYIVSVGRESILAAPGQKVFVRGIEDEGHDRFTVYRRGQEYRTSAGEVIGLEAVHVGDAVLTETGDPATLILTSTNREVRPGDRLFPVLGEDVNTHFTPRAPVLDRHGEIVAVFDGVTQIGQHQVVVIDLGEKHGVEPGHVLTVYQRGGTIVDPYAKPPRDAKGGVVGREHLELDPARQGGARGVFQAADDYVVNLTNSLAALTEGTGPIDEPWQVVDLPDERAGTVMVFRSFETLSYALVMDATRAMHVYDTLRSP